MGAFISSIIGVPMLIFRRISVLYDLRKLRIIKITLLKQHLIKQRTNPNIIFQDDVYQITQQQQQRQLSTMKNYLKTLQQTFTLNQFGFLFTLIKQETKERFITERFLMFWLGILFTLFYFYTQVFLFQKFQTMTLILITVMAITTIILPQFSRWMQSFALILIPRSIMILLRGAILSVIAFQIQTVTRMNIERNYKIIVTSLQCNVRKTARFTSKSLSVGFLDSKGKKSFHFNFENPIRPFVNFIQNYAETMQNVYDGTRLTVGKISSASSRLAHVYSYTPVGWLMDLFTGVVQKATESLKNFGQDMLKQLKQYIMSFFVVRFEPNYEFHWKSSHRNRTIKWIISDSLNELTERHGYFHYVIDFLERVVHLYVFAIFILIFFPPLLYIWKYRYNRSFDNFYITDRLIAYDEQMVEHSNVLESSIFPLKVFEQLLYIRRIDPRLTIKELQTTLWSFVVDFALLFYVLTFILIDFLMYELVVLVAKIYDFLYELSLPEQFPKFLQFLNATSSSSSSLNDTSFFKADDQFIDDYRLYRQEIRKCIPIVSPIDWQPYHKCLIYFCLLMIWKLFRPYINRTRSLICSRLFPQLTERRVHYLYNDILFKRMIAEATIAVAEAVFINDFTKLMKLATSYIQRKFFTTKTKPVKIDETKCNKCHQPFSKDDLFEFENRLLFCKECYPIDQSSSPPHENEDEDEDVSEIIDSSLEDFLI